MRFISMLVLGFSLVLTACVDVYTTAPNEEIEKSTVVFAPFTPSVTSVSLGNWVESKMVFYADNGVEIIPDDMEISISGAQVLLASHFVVRYGNFLGEAREVWEYGVIVKGNYVGEATVTVAYRKDRTQVSRFKVYVSNQPTGKG